MDSECDGEQNGGECPAEGDSLAETRPTLRHAFRNVHGFILHAVRGERMQFLRIILLENSRKNSGKLSEELLSISRRCVSADQASSCKREIEKRDWAEQRQLTAEGAPE